MKIAILVTCFNRRNITLLSLESLDRSISRCENDIFDIYLVDDASTDGTYEAVKAKYPYINLIRGSGSLYWGGGMNLAWKNAVESNVKYDGYFWFNDDSILFEDSLFKILKQNKELEIPTILSGAFLSSNHLVVTYGGKMRDSSSFVKPNGNNQEIELINGNLTYIPHEIFNRIGFIDKKYRHGLGDYDYGLRAIKEGFQCRLTKECIGISDRHDDIIPACYNKKNNILKRLKLLYSPLYNPISEFSFYSKHYNVIIALKVLLKRHLYLFSFYGKFSMFKHC